MTPANRSENNSGAAVERPRVSIKSPADLVAAVPYLLGFHPPADSLVAVATDGPHGTAVLRFDLPEPSNAGAVQQISQRCADVLARNTFATALLVGYGPGDRVTSTIEAVAEALTNSGITVHEMLRVADSRWWSYLCTNPNCCPPDGTAYDINSSVIAATATVAGQVAFADRAELVRSLAPVEGAAREAMIEATDRAEREFLDTARRQEHVSAVRTSMVEQGVPLIEALYSRARHSGDPATDDEIARLGILLTNLRLRDEAWVRMQKDHADADIRFWADVLRRVQPDYAAAPGCLLAYAAYAAYISGDGCLANVALARASDSDSEPDYTLAKLLRDLIAYGVPPSKAQLRMTPQDLAAAYNEQQPTTRTASQTSLDEGGRDDHS